MEKKTFRILTVDDEILIRDLISEILNNNGYEVTTATSGVEALAHINKSAFDLVLCDIGMPGKSGFEVFNEIKKVFPDIKFVFVSAFDNHENIKKCMSIGAKAFIGKPFDPDELLDVVENVLKN